MKKSIAEIGMPTRSVAAEEHLVRRRRLCMAMAGLLTTVPIAARAEPPWEFLMNRWKQDQYLNIQRGPVESSQIAFGWWSAHWRFLDWKDLEYLNSLKCFFSCTAQNKMIATLRERFEGWYFIQNRFKPEHFLHVENGVLEAGPVQEGFESAAWAPTDAGDNFVRIRNRYKTDWYLQIDPFGKAAAGPMSATYWSGHWRRYGAP